METPFTQFTQSEFLRPTVDGWLGKIERARQCHHRRWWQDNADQSLMFYCAATGFMWDGRHATAMFGGPCPAKPKFRMTINKAFELVALTAPVIMNRYPIRQVKPRPAFDLPPGLFGDPNDPNVQQFTQQMQAQAQQMQLEDGVRAALMERWLNYTPREQPGGGLLGHCERAVTAALIKGRACLWARDYKMPGSGRVLTGLFEDDPSNLFIDPDATSLHDARWIAQKCTHPIWWVEREYNLPVGSLKNKGNAESAWMQGEAVSNPDIRHARTNGETFDLLTYYKIYSKGGAGARLSGVSSPLKRAFDEVVGDHAYIVVAPGVPFPLNAPTFRVREWDDQQVKAAFQWPIPFWADDRWPVAILDFYDKPLSPWPVAPLAPALGELKAINMFFSFLASHVWSGSRTFHIAAKQIFDQIKSIYEAGQDQGVFSIDDAGTGQDVGKLFATIQQPQTNLDVWRIIEALMSLFDRRTGLTDLAYGLNPGGTQPRTAEEMSVKQHQLNIRPDYMAHRVEEWLSEGARLEAFVTRWKVDARNLAGLLPPMGQQLWHNLIWSTDVEKVVRELDFTVMAGTARKPNKDRDVANIAQAMQFLFPMATNYAAATSDTTPLNWLVQKWGDSVDQPDMAQFQLGPWAPPPPPPGSLTPQQMAEMDFQQQMQFKQLDHELSQRIKIAELQTKLAGQQATTQQQLGTQRATAAQKQEITAADSLLRQGVQQAEATQRMRLDRAEFAQDLQQDQAAWQAEMRRAEREFAVELANKKKLAAVQRQAAAKKPAAGKSPKNAA